MIDDTCQFCGAPLDADHFWMIYGHVSCESCQLDAFNFLNEYHGKGAKQPQEYDAEHLRGHNQ